MTGSGSRRPARLQRMPPLTGQILGAGPAPGPGGRLRVLGRPGASLLSSACPVAHSTRRARLLTHNPSGSGSRPTGAGPLEPAREPAPAHCTAGGRPVGRSFSGLGCFPWGRISGTAFRAGSLGPRVSPVATAAMAPHTSNDRHRRRATGQESGHGSRPAKSRSGKPAQ